MAAQSIVQIMLRAAGGRQVATETGAAAKGLTGLRSAAVGANAAAVSVGRTLSNDVTAGLRRVTQYSKYAAVGLVGLAAYGVKSGVALSAQWQDLNASFTTLLGNQDKAARFVETMRGLTDATPFRLTEALDAARGLIGAGMGTGGVRDTLEAVRNAAMVAGGDPSEKFGRMAEILGVIQARGKVSADELQRFDQLGVPIRKGIQKELGLTADEVANIGNESVSSARFMRAFTRMMTTGNMARAAKNAGGNFSVQSQTLRKNFEQIERVATAPLFEELNQTVMPQLLDTSKQVIKVFEEDGLTTAERFAKAWKVGKRELGPFVDSVEQGLKDAHLDERLGDVVEWAAPKMADAAARSAPKAASAFVNAFREMGPWGKLITVGLLAKRFGSTFRTLGRTAAGAFLGGAGGKSAGALAGRGATPMNPLYVSIVGAPTGQVPVAPPVDKGSIARRLAPFAIGGFYGAGAAAGVYGVAKTLQEPADREVQRGRLSPLHARLDRLNRTRRDQERRYLEGVTNPLTPGFFMPRAHASRLRRAAASAGGGVLNVRSVVVMPNGKVLAEAVAQQQVRVRDTDRHGG